MPALDPVKKITWPFLESQIKKKGPGSYSIGDNLYLRVKPTGAMSWVFRYTLNERTKEMGLGATKVTNMTEARETALRYRRLLRDGKDPKTEKQRAAQADAPVAAFQTFAEQYVADNEDQWKSPVYTRQWKQTLQDYTYPVIGKMLVDQITRDDVLRILKPIWADKNPTAKRLRWRIETVLDAAKAAGMRTGDNPAAYAGNLQPVLPRVRGNEVKHHAALPYKDLPEFIVQLRGRDAMAARALEFCILTATRTSETLGAVRSEFDFVDNLWTIPASRMKAGKEHRIPLSPQAVACIPDHNRDAMFPGHSANHLSNMAMTMTLRRILGKDADVTVHGFRSCFRDWAAEQTSFPGEACEIALAHNPKGAVEAAYSRTDYLGMRRSLMTHWASYCDGVVPYIDPHADNGASYERYLSPVVAS